MSRAKGEQNYVDMIRKITVTDGTRERIFFVQFNSSLNKPNPKEFEGSLLYILREPESKFKTGLSVRSAEDKIRGGGTYPVSWRGGSHIELPVDVDFPIDDSDKDRIVEFLANKFPGWIKENKVFNK